MSDFYRDMLRGNQAKELVKVLLEKSGYLVLPYGYESTLSDMKRRLRERGARNSRTIRRIRTSPDLLVYDGERKDAILVEIKMRRALKATSIKYLKVANYKEFWDDSVLVLVIPSGNVFYAQKISELEIKQTYNAHTDFEKFEDFFTRVTPEDVADFRAKARPIVGE